MVGRLRAVRRGAAVEAPVVAGWDTDVRCLFDRRGEEGAGGWLGMSAG